jgi:hypothetical protein
LPAKIIPFAKALYLCDGHIRFANQKTDLIGLFTSIRPKSYPHIEKYFVVFAQLTSGLGRIPFYLDLRLAGTGRLIYTSNTHFLFFPSRTKLVHMVYAVQGCVNCFTHNGTNRLTE